MTTITKQDDNYLVKHEKFHVLLEYEPKDYKIIFDQNCYLICGDHVEIMYADNDVEHFKLLENKLVLNKKEIAFYNSYMRNYLTNVLPKPLICELKNDVLYVMSGRCGAWFHHKTTNIELLHSLCFNKFVDNNNIRFTSDDKFKTINVLITLHLPMKYDIARVEIVPKIFQPCLFKNLAKIKREHIIEVSPHAEHILVFVDYVYIGVYKHAKFTAGEIGAILRDNPFMFVNETLSCGDIVIKCERMNNLLELYNNSNLITTSKPAKYETKLLSFINNMNVLHCV